MVTTPSAALKQLLSNSEQELDEAGLADLGLGPAVRAALVERAKSFLPEPIDPAAQDYLTKGIDHHFRNQHQLNLRRNRKLITDPAIAYKLGRRLASSFANQLHYLRHDPEQLAITAERLLDLDLHARGCPKVHPLVMESLLSGAKSVVRDELAQGANKEAAARVSRFTQHLAINQTREAE